MKFWEWLFGRRKAEEAKRRKKKILLGTLIPLSLIVVAAGAFLVCLYGCKLLQNSGYIPRKDIIEQATIDEKGLYKVSAGEEIWYDKASSATFGHDLFDLKAWSDDHNDTTNFVVSGTVNFGFLVDFNMDCHLIGFYNELTKLSGADGGCGVVVGEKIEPENSVQYSGIMNIEPTMTFDVFSTYYFACGVLIGNVSSNSTLIINGTFTIKSPNYTAVGFMCGNSAGSTTINGVFIISGIFSQGVSWAQTANSSVQLINGNFYFIDYYSNNERTDGVEFVDVCGGTTTINGTFVVSSKGSIFLVHLWDNIISGSQLTINGIFLLKCLSNNVYDQNFSCVRSLSPTNYGSIINNGIFILWGWGTSIGGCSFFCDDAWSDESLSMSSSQFFSNKKDNQNIFTKNPGWSGSYQWNGVTISGSNTSVGDSALTLKEIKDDDNDTHLTVDVIDTDGRSGASKTAFNTAYKNALINYVQSNDCPTTAKPWLESIINQITL